MRLTGALLLCLFLASRPAPAADSEKRSSTIDFEGEVVEGVRQPGDSDEGQLVEGVKRPVNTLGQQGAGKTRHVYRKRIDFKGQSRELVRELMETY